MEYNQSKAHYIVSTVIIVKEGKYFIAKRADWEKVYPNKWTVPGGKLEKEDYINQVPDTSDGQWYNIFENVAEREVFEETGLKIKNINYLTSLAFIRPDNIPAIVVSLYADFKSGDVCLSKDLTEFAWVSLEEAKHYDLIDGIYKELEMLDRHLHGGSLGNWSKS